jgi:hypothetical protein
VARVGVSVVKSTSFRGVQQNFSNTYYYETPLPVLPGSADALVDAIVAKEKAIHSPRVTFLRGLCWTTGGTKAENNMLVQKNLSGTGNGASPSTAQDKERAFLVRFRAGNDSRGNPVYLRKWWHLDIGVVASEGISNAQLENTAALSSAQRAQIVTWGDGFKSVQAATQNFDLVSKNGRDIDGATQAHQYLEHHQLGDMWRG